MKTHIKRLKTKKSKSLLLIIALLAAIMLSGCVDQYAATGAQGSLSNGIVTTSVRICEILDALGVTEVIGVPDTEIYTLPEAYQNAEKIGAPMSPDIEIIASLSPDWVLSPMSLENDLAEKYEQAQVKSVFLNLNSVSGMYKSISQLGELLGKEKEAQSLVNEYEKVIEDFEKSIADKEKPRVLILMGLPGSYVAATEYSYAGSLVKLAGAENVYEGETEEFINVNTEDMLARDPDYILLTSHALPDQVAQMFEDEFSQNDIWQHFRAVQKERVYTMDHEKFGMSATFEYPAALDDLYKIFYED